MRSPFRNFRPADPGLVTVAVLVAALTVVVGCAGPGPELAAPIGSQAAPDRVIAGPQGAEGQFVVECRFDRFVADDPIVHPGESGGSHLHQFFGAVGVSVASTHDEMLAGPTTCDQQADTASYWTPALLDAAGTPIEPLKMVAYYRAGPDVDPLDVIPFSPGLMMVAGDHTATEPQPLSVVAWSCGQSALRGAEPTDCTGAPSLRLWVTFPDCWNGEDVRSPIVPEPSRHVAYSSGGACPATHPVSIPQLQLAVDFPVPPAADVEHLALSSGDIHSGHADFWNVWDQAKLQREVSHCIHRDLPCGVSG